ncbi:hypothetical protein [Maribacter spongiicola]|uniref:hypothetical protein n=1 Tax=Maribacter spongiicola TaxID=1206753 RepID=UPI003F94842B
MKIQYNKKRQNYNLAFGIVWAIIGLVSISYGEENKIGDYLFLLASILYFGLYFYERTNQYITITENEIKKNTLFGKKINIAEITSIKKIAGDYILKTDKAEMIINTELIKEDSFKDLINTLSNLNLPPNKTPFYSTD